VIVLVAWFVVRWHAFILVKYLALVLVSFAATLGIYQLLVRRFRITRLLFGMKPAPDGSTPAASGDPVALPHLRRDLPGSSAG
jgi:hypothetical protein